MLASTEEKRKIAMIKATVIQPPLAELEAALIARQAMGAFNDLNTSVDIIRRAVEILSLSVCEMDDFNKSAKH